jgi:hypothetical protein
MLVRFRRMKPVVQAFTAQHTTAKHFALRPTEWKQIEYLIDITKPFAYFTKQVSETKGVTVPYAIDIFNQLFERLFEARRRLEAKKLRYNWVKPLLTAIDKAELKLDKYYKKLFGEVGTCYAFGTILSPDLKLGPFDPDFLWLHPDSAPANSTWKDEFQEQFSRAFCTHYANANMTSLLQDRLIQSRIKNTRPISQMRARISSSNLSSQADSEENSIKEVLLAEVRRYLEECMCLLIRLLIFFILTLFI